MHIAYYLKYRPQNLDGLIGQEAVKKTLLSAYQANKLSHAYLFFGPRGTGKTSTARILAKMVNCERKKVPCNSCSACISITDGSNMDLVEIDAASNRGIEDIRALREKIKLSPTGLKKKVYIIDETHMLTLDAFNALLKTLEEPPAHALFILATTDISKIPQTILSRVQKLDFNLATPAELMEVLKKISGAEKINIEEDALKLLIKKSDGSFRDGVKLLEQVTAFGEKITSKIVEEGLKQTEFENLLLLFKALAAKNGTESLLNITAQIDRGVDSKQIILSLMDGFRNLIFIKNELGENLVKPHLSEEKYLEIAKIAESFSLAEIIRNLEILQQALEKLKTASMPSLPLEIAVVEMTQSVILSDSGVKSEESKDLLQMQVPNKNTLSSPTPLDSQDLSKIKEKWTFVLETIRPYNFSLEALLRSINIRECTETQVVMEVPYSFHQRILEAPKNRDLLESILSDILGRSIHVATMLGTRPQKKEDIVNIEVAADDEIIRAAAEIFNSDSIN